MRTLFIMLAAASIIFMGSLDALAQGRGGSGGTQMYKRDRQQVQQQVHKQDKQYYNAAKEKKQLKELRREQKQWDERNQVRARDREQMRTWNEDCQCWNYPPTSDYMRYRRSFEYEYND